MDAITIQILRNKIASLVDEMHYHFYRSGYSTIIRELRDFSCVILDRNGRLIVAPPMFFHAPVYRHLVGRILELYGDARRCDQGRRRIRLQSSLRRRTAARLRHGVRRAGLRRRRSSSRSPARSRTRPTSAARCAGSTSANATEMFHEGLLLPPIKIVEGGERAARYRAHHPHQQPAAGADARRHPRPDRGDANGRRRGSRTCASASARAR